MTRERHGVTKLGALVVGLSLALACVARSKPAIRPRSELSGLATWYGDKHHGRKTASGEPFDMHDMTAAHKTLPLGTWVRVTNLDNGKTVEVRINDRGPYRPGLVIDMSKGAAHKLGMVRRGVVRAKIEVLGAY